MNQTRNLIGSVVEKRLSSGDDVVWYQTTKADHQEAVEFKLRWHRDPESGLIRATEFTGYEDGERAVKDGVRVVAANGSTMARIKKAIANGHHTASDIGEAIDRSGGQVRGAIDRDKSGQIVKEFDGTRNVYSLADGNEQEANQ